MRQYHQVDSSNIDGLFYEATTARLYVQFKGGVEYYYSDVPVTAFDALMHAESKGKHLNAHIKPTYGYHKVLAGEDDHNFDVVRDTELVLTEADVMDDGFHTATNDPMRGLG